MSEPTRGTRGSRRIVRRSDVTARVARGRPRQIVRRARDDSPPIDWSRTPGRGVRRVRRAHLRLPLPRVSLPARVLAPLVRITVLVAAIGLLVATGVYAWRSQLLRIQEIEVTGTFMLPADDIAARAGLVGQHMVTADLAAAQRNVASLPLVRSVRIERKWPNTVRLTVEERAAWGSWEQAGVRYAIDRDGVVLGPYPAPEGYPVILSSAPTSLREGDHVSYQAVDAAAEIYERLPRALTTEVTEVAFLDGKGVQVTTADGQVALLGDSSSIAYKLAVWAAAATEAQRMHINYQLIDLRWGNRPVLQ